MNKNGFKKFLDNSITSMDPCEMVVIFYDIILLSYCKVDKEGKPLPKDYRDLIQFQNSRAFRTIWKRCCNDQKFGSEFVIGITPDPKEVQPKFGGIIF